MTAARVNAGFPGGMPTVWFAGFESNQVQFLAKYIEVPKGRKPVDELCVHDLFRTELINPIDHLRLMNRGLGFAQLSF